MASKIIKISSSSFSNNKKTTLCSVFQYGHQYGCQVHIQPTLASYLCLTEFAPTI